jgi:hypothetical protein
MVIFSLFQIYLDRFTTVRSTCAVSNSDTTDSISPQVARRAMDSRVCRYTTWRKLTSIYSIQGFNGGEFTMLSAAFLHHVDCISIFWKNMLPLSSRLKTSEPWPRNPDAWIGSSEKQ